MAPQLLTESPEKTRRQDTHREPHPASARSLNGGACSTILQLQRTLGNQRVAQLIQTKRLTPEGRIIGLQPKLTVGAQDDQYEREADRVARQVVSMPDSAVTASFQQTPLAENEKNPTQTLQSKSLPVAASSIPLITPFAQRQTRVTEEVEDQKDKEEDREELLLAKLLNKSAARPPALPLQRRMTAEEEEVGSIQAESATPLGGSFEAGEEIESQVNWSKGQGSPLPDSVRAYMEPRFGTDFGHVRVHTGSNAIQMNRDIGAHAFTHGSDIFFGAGSSPANLELTAHELTHVVQQTGAPPLQRQKQDASIAPGPEPSVQWSRLAHSREEKRSVSISLNVDSGDGTVLARFPSPPSGSTFVPGLSYMKPVIKEGYDGMTYTAIKNNWGLSSWERSWRIYDADDNLLYESFYTWPQPTLYIPEDVVTKGKAGGKQKPWSVWHEVTKTLVPFGGSDPENFPYAYMKFYVYDTWNDFMADPDAKLSDIQKTGEEDTTPAKPTPLDSSIVEGSRSVIDYGSVVAMHEAYLREIYDSSAKGITETAKELVSKGMPQGEAAKWANEARNELKAKIRADGNPILKKVFEARNLNKYGNKLGPSYEKLYQKYSKQGLSPEEINKKIIESSAKANIKVNRWSGRLKVAGRIMIAIDIALAGVRVYLAPEGEKTKVALEEVARIGGALAFGALGAKGGAAAGAAVGALFGGAGAVPGAIIGGIIGGIGGAIFGGWLGQTAVEKLYEMFPPSDCVFEGEFTEEDR